MKERKKEEEKKKKKRRFPFLIIFLFFFVPSPLFGYLVFFFLILFIYYSSNPPSLARFAGSETLTINSPHGGRYKANDIVPGKYECTLSLSLLSWDLFLPYVLCKVRSANLEFLPTVRHSMRRAAP